MDITQHKKVCRTTINIPLTYEFGFIRLTSKQLTTGNEAFFFLFVRDAQKPAFLLKCFI